MADTRVVFALVPEIRSAGAPGAREPGPAGPRAGLPSSGVRDRKAIRSAGGSQHLCRFGSRTPGCSLASGLPPQSGIAPRRARLPLHRFQVMASRGGVGTWRTTAVDSKGRHAAARGAENRLFKEASSSDADSRKSLNQGDRGRPDWRQGAGPAQESRGFPGVRDPDAPASLGPTVLDGGTTVAHPGEGERVPGDARTRSPRPCAGPASVDRCGPSPPAPTISGARSTRFSGTFNRMEDREDRRS